MLERQSSTLASKRQPASQQDVNAAPKPVRVLLVDDHPAVTRQVIRLLPEEYEIVEALDSGAGLNRAVQQHDPDLIVLDITLPEISGIQLARGLKADGCRAKIVFLTVHNDPDYAREALAVGALGYVLKARIASDLLSALRHALAGDPFISRCAELEELG